MNRFLFFFIVILLSTVLIYLLKKFFTLQDKPSQKEAAENKYFEKLVKEAGTTGENEIFPPVEPGDAP